MRVICAPDSFKETLTAKAAAEAMAAGVRAADPTIECDVCPVADGGEGTLDALVRARGGTVHVATVTGPLWTAVQSRFGILDDGKTGIVELAEASGLALVPERERTPMRTTTFGTGELIRLAHERGCAEVIVCIGGSATVDGGTGIAQALGAKFSDEAGREIEAPMTGGKLARIASVRPIPFKQLPRIRVACDVTNPLCGPNGAAAVYGPQKGATPEQVHLLDEGLAKLAKVVVGDVNAPGAGAAGGAGFGLVQMCGATLERGIDLVLDAIDFCKRAKGACLVLTGEGRLDQQSLHGKACMGVARAAAQLGVPAIAIVGSTGAGAGDCTNPARGGQLKSSVDLTARFGRERAWREAASLVRLVAEDVIRTELKK